MAYVNVAEWKTDQVCEWLKGLDTSVLPYVHSFTNNTVNGQQLLNLRSEDLEQLGVLKLGHQEIILEAVEYLRNFHYELDRENLQLLALHLSCKAHSLHNELSRQTDSKPVTTQTLADVASVVTAVKPLVRWLDRPPFGGQLEYNDKKSQLLKLSLEMATCAQRDRFAEKPIEEIRSTCEQLAKLADYVIQDIADPMILQPASLDLATLKKRPGDDLGFYILPSFHGNHQIAEIKFGSAAHTCGKMEEGDEIVQVNYQTVVGWERKNVLELFNESPAEVLLTLKRRPRHTKVYGQIYIKPYRLPSNKKTPYATRWQHNLPSPRPELLTIPDFTMPLPRHVPKEPSPEKSCIVADNNSKTTSSSMLVVAAAAAIGAGDGAGKKSTSDNSSGSSSSSNDSDSEIEPRLSRRLYGSKPRNLVQRRATITGASPTTKHGIDIEQFWKELKQEHSTSFQLRDKAASCAHGLDNVQSSNNRPQTCLGIEQTKQQRKKQRNEERNNDERKVQFDDKTRQYNCEEDCISQSGEMEKMLNDGARSVGTAAISNKSNCSDISVPLDKCDETCGSSQHKDDDEAGETKGEEEVAIAGGARKERGKLDKSYSTPAYDLNESSLIDIIDKSSSNKIDNLVYHSAKIATSITTNETDTGLSNETLDDKRIVKPPSPLPNLVDDDNEELRNQERGTKLNIVSSVAHRVNRIEYMQQHQRINNKNPNERQPRENNENIRNDGGDGVVEEKTEILNSQVERNETVVGGGGGEFGGRESSEEKSESTSSYVEGGGVSSSETDLPLQKCIENEEGDASSLLVALTPEESNDKSSGNTTGKENDSFQKMTNDWSTTTSSGNSRPRFDVDHPNPCAGIPNNKSNSMNCPAKRLETRPRGLTPPEPPPRKYFSKPLPIHDAGAALNCSDPRDTFGMIGVDHRAKINEANGGTAWTTGGGGAEGYRDFVEKSSDFIDENPHEKSSSFIDHYGYTEIYEGPTKPTDDKNDKYEPFTEKFSSKNVHLHNDQGHSETLSRSGVDSPDGSGCSRPTRTLDSRAKQYLENKDKHCERGVVNRAMMVARSIGLHTGSNKSCSNNSPRSTRKRNLLLAKRRNVSVKEVGAGDLEGWLTHRSRGAGGAWARSWFVLKSASLYRFKAQDSVKSDCLIALPGFTASTAAEVKSRRNAFKVYHTGTVFYFAADTEDCLALWLDSINKATLGADSQNRTSGLFSETDESESECGGGASGASGGGGGCGSGGGPKSTSKGTTNETKQSPALLQQPAPHSHESMFGSLKKMGRKESTTNYKEHEIVAASLDRKYLRFLGSRNQNVPVPTAQFRSYRRVLPTSTPNRKQDSSTNSPDLRVTVAGSTFYGLSASQSATDVPSTSQDMGDYRQTTDRSPSIRGVGSGRRSDDLRGFITLEEFMLGHRQSGGGQDNPSSCGGGGGGGTLPRSSNNDGPSTARMTPLTSDHVHVRHKNFDDGSVGSPSSGGGGRAYGDFSLSNGMIYGHPRNGEEDTARSILEDTLHRETTKSLNSLQRQHAESHSPKPEENMQHHHHHHHNHHLQLTAASERNGKKSPLGNGCSYNRKNQEGVVFYPNKQQNTDSTRWENVSNEITSELFNNNTVQNLTNRQADSGQSRFRADIRRSRRRRHRRDSPPSNLSRIQPGNDHHDDCNNEECCCKDTTRDSPPPPPLTPRRFVRDTGYVGSSGDLSCCASSFSDTLERVRKETSGVAAAFPVTRKGSFNLKDRRAAGSGAEGDENSADKNWMDSLRRNSDKKRNNSSEKARLKNVAQYQPPPIPSCPFEQDRMRATFEMHLDKANEQQQQQQQHSQKTNRLKSLFGAKNPQKPNTLDLPKDSPRTLLGSPRLHRALFRDKSWNQQQQQQQRQPVRSASQSPGDSGISQSLSSYSGNSQSQNLSQSFSSVSSVMSDWSPETPTANAISSKPCTMGHPACQKRFSSGNKNWMTPPSLPYIPPPTSTPPPPDDYPGLEYPPVFEPGTYSLTDPSLIRNRSGKTATSSNKGNESGDNASNVPIE